jgi:hypothetical protein
MEKDPQIQIQESNNPEITIPDGFVSTADVEGGESKTSTWRKIRDKEQERLKAA